MHGLRPSRIPLFLGLAILAAALATPVALADTFQLFTVAQTQSSNFAAGDDFGDYAINISSQPWAALKCGNTPHCYQVGTAGHAGTYYTSTLPAFPTNPNPATPGPAPQLGANWSLTAALGGLFAGSYFDPVTGSQSRGIFDGTDPVLNKLSGGSLDGGFTSANGNVFFIDGLDNTLVVALDLNTTPTPEPGTLLLMSSGGCAFVTAALRRKHVGRHAAGKR